MSRTAEDIAWEMRQEAIDREESMAGSLERVADALELIVEIQQRSPANVGWMVRKLLLGPAAVVHLGLEPNGDIYIAWGRAADANTPPALIVEEHASGSSEVVPALARLVDRVKEWRAQFEDAELPF